MVLFLSVVFSSITFLVYYIPFLLLLYSIISPKYKNGLLLIASIIFYSWGAPKFIFVILITTFLDFFLVRAMDKRLNEGRRKIILVLSVSMNLGLLFYFKYCNFFIENANSFLEAMGSEPFALLNVVLPIGISFYTFESLTYVVDVYRRVHKPLQNFWHYQLYIILFPKLIAGPIIRYHEIADQIPDRAEFDNVDNKLLGFYRFCLGLSKKVFIANTMAAVADDVFRGSPELLSAGTAWVGMLSYSFQIYFDFSGYSDMAIGLGRMFGFRFPENFNNPYTSQSITEFWRRWHITLGNWMKNYLYIPLGGNKVNSRWRLFFNLWLVFLASGFWHGAAWTFIVWGIYHGTLLILERLFLLKLLSKTGTVFSTLFTFLLVCIGWIIFRADTLEQGFGIIKKLFDFSPVPEGLVLHPGNDYVFYFVLALVFSFFTCIKAGQKLQEKVYFDFQGLRGTVVFTIVSCILFTLAIASIASTNFNPFIYFRF